jgi:arylsulfatase A-like enzyme
MKGSKWEGGIRVPYVVRWKNNLMPSLYNKPVSSLDIAATSLTLAGDTLEAMNDLDGINILPFLTGSEKGIPHDILCWRRGPAGAVRNGDWKLIIVEQQPPLLFNIKKDIGETINLAQTQPKKVIELQAMYDTWESEMVEPLWVAEKIWTDRQIAKHKMDVIGREAERKIP